uniref:Uncharacterized protein n=1 Tax=Glossina austeni TaxID=7395 RepID=A0A1A9VNV5_GLOAU
MKVRKKPTIFMHKNYSCLLNCLHLQDSKKSASRYSAILSYSECKENSGKCEHILRNSRITCGQHCNSEGASIIRNDEEFSKVKREVMLAGLLINIFAIFDRLSYDEMSTDSVICEKCKLIIVSSMGSIDCGFCKSSFHPGCAKKIMPWLTQPTVDAACGNSVDLAFKCHVCLIRAVSPIADMEVLQEPERDADILSNASDELDKYVVLEFDESKTADTSSAQSTSPFEDLITGSKLSLEAMENCLPKLVNKNSDAASCDDKIDYIEEVVAVISENNADSCHLKEEDKASELFSQVTEEILLQQDDNISKASGVPSVDRIETFAETAVNNSPLVKSPDSSLRHQKVGVIEGFVDGKSDNKARSFYSLAGISSFLDKTRKFNITSRIMEKLSPKQDAGISGEPSCIEDSDNEQANADSSRPSRSTSPVECNGFTFSCKAIRSMKISSYNT